MVLTLRSFLVVLALVFGAHATGVLEGLSECCAEPCDDDNDEGHCPPTCGACACAPRINEPARVLASVRPPEGSLIEPSRALDAELGAPDDGFAEEIAHVPIVSIAA